MNKIVFILFVSFLGNPIFAQLNKVTSAMRAGNLIFARDYIDSLSQTKTFENDPEAFWLKGLVYESCYFSKDSNVIKEVFEPLIEASDAYNKALKLNRKEINSLVIKQIDSSLSKNLLCEGLNLMEKRKLNDAIRYLELYLDYKPKDSIIYLNMAVAADRAKDSELAIKYYEKIVFSSYRTPFVLKSLFFLYKNESKFDDADRIVRMTQSIYPNDIDVLKMQIGLLLEKNNFETAKKEIRKVVANPSIDATDFYYNLGKIYQVQDSISLAIANYEASLKINPSYFNSLFNMGGIYYESARKIYEKINAMEFDVYQKNGKKEENAGNALAMKALPYFEKCYTLNPNDLPTKQILVSIYRNLKLNDRLRKIESN